MEYTINCNGKLISLGEPQVMGVVNATPDSFYADSRKQTETDIANRVEQILTEGGTIVDVGACSTRPGALIASEEEEMSRLRFALAVVRHVAPDAVVSIDTFRPAIARMSVEEFGADIINDVGGVALMSSDHSNLHADQQPMFRMVSRLRVPYIYMSSQSTMGDIMLDCAAAVDSLRSMGQKDIILDPGFGFGKTLEQNYKVYRELDRLQTLELPVLVGISRKSMIFKLLQTDPLQALNGTTVLNTVALLKGASILRVHDVREAVECVKIVGMLHTENVTLITENN